MRKLATVRKIVDIQPIEGADRIVLAVVDGWKCVIKKGDFQVGELVIYCEIDSFLPVRDEFEFLRKSSFKRMGEREGFRLRTVKLRGQISQGLLLPCAMVGRSVEIGEDVSDALGIIKYEPPVPACLTGEVVGGFPASIQKTDEERVQNLVNDFPTWTGKTFFVSEKLDGTSFTAFWDQEYGVCGRNWQLAQSDKNTHWQIARQLDLRNKLASLGRPIAIQGELLGPGIQKNRYGLKQHELFVFNVFDMDRFGYLDKRQLNELCQQLNLKTVPAVGGFPVPESMDQLIAMAEGPSAINRHVEREGVVI